MPQQYSAGMMTGQILGGSPVTEAAHYQILIMYLIATCTFIPIFLNLFIVYRVAFDAQTHALRTDRFFEVVKTKQKQKEIRIGITQRLLWGVKNLVYPIFGRQRDMIGNSEIQPLENNSGNEKTNRIQILTRQFACNEFESEPLFCIADLSFSVPKSHRKIRLDHPRPLSTPESEMSTAPTRSGRNSPQLQSQQTSVLCTNLNASIHVGEIGIVRGPSGCGKSSLLRVLAGLAPMDGGDVMVSGQSLAACSGRNGGSMVQWRTSVRYVTQHKADLPGTPRDFILRILSFYSHSTFETPSEDEMMTQILWNLQHWGMGESAGDDDSYTADADLDQDHNSYLDNEWKTLSGGESQRILLAIAMASRAKVLLLDEATSGLDNETEKLVEESIIDYAKKKGAAVLWVTHSEDIVERLLSRQC